MAESENFTEDDMVIVDGIRYRPEDAPKSAAAKKGSRRAPSAENKARTADPGPDAGESGAVATK